MVPAIKPEKSGHAWHHLARRIIGSKDIGRRMVAELLANALRPIFLFLFCRAVGLKVGFRALVVD
jgi:hypothetical protein